ncbi:hypothetical protein N1851_029240 [Merluccius polli]|uniref:Uncharacterized protein n=1 Tax=Merluccius polli TaxID=89951 RepID=A0AA47M793_MERPO|nr:hypothetical protein N1851_029240 [Merluccius polli]
MERLSGSAKRKIKNEKLVRNAENLKHIPKIGTFFNAITTTKAAPVEEEDKSINSPPPAESAPRSLDTETPLAASSSSDDSPVAVPASTASATTTEGNNNDDVPSVSPPPIGTTSTPMLPGDPALWPPITEQLREEALYRGPAAFHNRASKYPASCLNASLAYRFPKQRTSHQPHSKVSQHHSVELQSRVHKSSQ